MTIVGTRPEIIKLSRVIAELDKYTDHILVHSGQNYDYELNEIFFRDLEIRKPNFFLDVAGETAADTIAAVISKADKIMALEKPDAVLFYGDTNTCLAIISAKKRKIPIFHMEAGNRCFDQRVPEEVNRKIVDHLSDINMTLTEHARRYLIAEGVPAERVIKTGSSMKEILQYYRPGIEKSEVLEKLNLQRGNFFLVSAHREENLDSEQNFIDLLNTLNSIAETYQKSIIVSTHPRTRQKLEGINNIEFNKKIQFLKPLGFFDYIKLQKSAFCVISDSGTLTEEAALLNIPAVMIRQVHERPEGMDEGVLVMSGLKKECVLEAINLVTRQMADLNVQAPMVVDYSANNVSKKVVRIILSYIEYVNRTVWFKND
mgnify:FL=1